MHLLVSPVLMCRRWSDDCLKIRQDHKACLIYECFHLHQQLMHIFLTFSSFLINTLLAGQGSSILRRLSLSPRPLPQDVGVILTGSKPQAGLGLVVAGTKRLGDPGARSGQTDPPAMAGAQLSPGSRASDGGSPRN